MIRKTILISILVAGVCGSVAATPDLPRPDTGYFTLVVSPTQAFRDIPTSIASVEVVCELRGYNQATFVPGMPPQVSTFVTKGLPPNLLTVPLGNVPMPDRTYSWSSTAKLVVWFTAGDFMLNPQGLNDPNSVTEAWCYFSLRGREGTLYAPQFDPSAVRAEIDFERQKRGFDYSGPIPLTQPPASAWPPLLTPRLDAGQYYRWHTAYLFPVPAWARPPIPLGGVR